MRNTAPCVAYVAWKIKARDPEANLVISPADHVVTDTECFKEIIQKGLEFSNSTNSIVTLGIVPVRADTGYGDIKVAKQDAVFYKVDAFKEKPNKETALKYLNEKCYYWNSGIFIWNVQTIEKAFRLFQPAMVLSLDQIADKFYTDKEQALVDAYYAQCPHLSVDYAIMEHADNIYAIPSSFGWSDLGTWGSLYEFSEKDATNNATSGNSIRMINSDNCIVNTSNGKRCILEGLSGYIVVENNESLLICKKESEQQIKEWV